MTLFYYIKTAFSYKSTIINQYIISSIKDFKLKKYILNNNSDKQAQCLQWLLLQEPNIIVDGIFFFMITKTV